MAGGFLSIGNGACVGIIRATAFVYARLRAVIIPACPHKNNTLHSNHRSGGGVPFAAEKAGTPWPITYAGGLSAGFF
jgi:hypothetical protein